MGHRVVKGLTAVTAPVGFELAVRTVHVIGDGFGDKLTAGGAFQVGADVPGVDVRAPTFNVWLTVSARRLHDQNSSSVLATAGCCTSCGPGFTSTVNSFAGAFPGFASPTPL